MPPERPGSADHADHGREARRATQEALDGLRDDSPSPPVIVRTSVVLVITFVAIAHITGGSALLDLSPRCCMRWWRSTPSSALLRRPSCSGVERTTNDNQLSGWLPTDAAPSGSPRAAVRTPTHDGSRRRPA